MVQKRMYGCVFYLCVPEASERDDLPFVHRTIHIDTLAQYNTRHVAVHACKYPTKLTLGCTILHVHRGAVRRDGLHRTHLLHPEILALRMRRHTLSQPTRPSHDMHGGGGG